MSAQAIAQALQGKRHGQDAWDVICPVHGGASLRVTEKDGTLLVYCHNGCKQEDVIEALRERGLWPDAPDPTPIRADHLVKEYDYGPAIKGRFKIPGGKTFRWRLRDGDYGRKQALGTLKERDLPLYRVADVEGSKDALVWVTEGEKAADACDAVGLVAVCHAGGASTKDFGAAFEALRGRDVVLWPDADEPGRALMRRVADTLQGIAASVRTLSPKGSERADAFDYFGAGGTADALLDELNAIPVTPTIEPVPDGYEVSLPDGGGFSRWLFTDLERSKLSLDADLEVWQEIPGVSREHFSQRVNLLSGSSRDNYVRQLKEMFGDFGWTAKLNRAIQLVRARFKSEDPSVILHDAEEDYVSYLLKPLVAGDGVTILFGQGGTGKTYVAVALATCLAAGLPFLGSDLQSSAVLYVDYEASAGALKRRMRRVLQGFEWDCIPALFYWPARGRAFHDIARAIKDKVQRDRIGAIVVDSAVLACGGNPRDEEVATRYFNAVASIGVPCLTVSHVTKDEDDKAQYPFGSIFWHNAARLTWNLRLDREDKGQSLHLGLYNRKSNEDREHEPIGIALSFAEEDGPVRLRRESAKERWAEERTLSDRIRDELAGGRKSVKYLADALQTTTATIRNALRRMSDAGNAGASADGSDNWQLVTRRTATDEA